MFRALMVSVCLLMFGAVAISAQTTLFSTALLVNGAGISNYEIDQRSKLLRVFGATGDLQSAAEEALIDERLYLQAAEDLNVVVSNREVREGMEEYSQRLNRSLDQFSNALSQFGVDIESFRSFVHAGLAWRHVVQQRFTQQATSVSEEAVDLAVGLQGRQSRTLVHLSEIAIPATDGDTEAALRIASEVESTVFSADQFAQAASLVSAAETASSGGDIGTRDIRTLPEQVQRVAHEAGPGAVTRPLVIGQVAYVFYVHTLETESRATDAVAMNFATLRLGPAEGKTAGQLADSIVARVDTCDDLFEESKAGPSENFVQQTIEAEQQPSPWSSQLEGLDSGEISIVPDAASPEGELVLVMLCSRKYVVNDEQIQSILGSLRNRKLEDYARTYLSDLRASAIIRRK